MIKFPTIVLLALACANNASAQTTDSDFHENFRDSTLRIDYIFSGNCSTQHISIDKFNMMPRWYGKRNRLSDLPIQGNGQVTVRRHDTGEVIYRNSFSTLFQEWLSYEEAKHTDKAFENVFLIPMPKDTVDITVDLRDNRHEITASMTQMVCPDDILIRHVGFDHVTPYVTLQKAADTSRCIHIAYVAEGYTKDEMDKFLQDAQTANDAIFGCEPFKSYSRKFNVVAVESVSYDSGTSEPSKGIWKKTALQSHFDTFYSDRYLTTLNLKDLHDQLAGVPYEHIIVLVNTDKYGGGGILNSYNLSMTHHPLYRQVVVHEFGHSFAGLADEYAYEEEQIPMYPRDVEPWEKNITTLVDFHGKWESLITPGTPIPTPTTRKDTNKRKLSSDDSAIGVYEGAGYCLKGVYRPATDCRMRSNEHNGFCQACRKALTDLIKFYTE